VEEQAMTVDRTIEPTRVGLRWGAALATFAAGLLVHEFVVYPLLISPRLPDPWELSWALRVAYLGPETLACLVAGAMMWSRRSVLLFGATASAIRVTLFTVQAVRGAEGYLQAQEMVPFALPVMLVMTALVYAAVAGIGRSMGAWIARRSSP
jgi:hypothetical protein